MNCGVSAIAFTAYMALVERVSTVMATSYVYVNPPIALLMGATAPDKLANMRRNLGEGRISVVLGMVRVA